MNSSIDILRPQCAVRSVGAANSAITGLLQALLAAYCELSYSASDWPPNYGPSYLNKGRETFDFIVVGGGTAGSVIAGRLSENPDYRVLLIEAGDNPPIESEIPGMAIDVGILRFGYDLNPNLTTCASLLDNSCQWPQGRYLGGLAALNFMVFLRGNKRDFDKWESLGNPTWGWNSVLEYFQRTEDYKPPNLDNFHGVGGPLVVDRFPQSFNVNLKRVIRQAAQEAGLPQVDDFRLDNYIGTGIFNVLVANGTRNTPAKAFLRSNRPNLQIIKNAIVTKVNFDRKKRARSVTFVYKDENNKRYELVASASKEIILSTGTVDSPKLLMLSGVGPKQHLKSFNIPVISDLPVGRHFEDHATATLHFKFDFAEEEQSQHANTYEYLTNRKGPLSGINIVDLGTFMDVLNESGVYPNMQLIHQWYPKGSPPDSVILSNYGNETFANIFKQSGMLVISMILLSPNSTGTIELQSKNYLQTPLISPNYYSDKHDLMLFIETIRKIIGFAKTPTYKKYGFEHVRIDVPACRKHKFNSDAYWECYLRQTEISYLFHPTSSVRMGPDSDPNAVVDYKLRVKGVKRLRVADASIMPRIVAANTMATTVMIGEKAADFIKKDWRCPAK